MSSVAVTLVFALIYWNDHLVQAKELRFHSTDPETLIQNAWIAFRTEYGKSYDTVEEEIRRKTLFYQTIQEINDHNYLYSMGLSTYKMGLNQFADMDFFEFMWMNGYRQDNVSRKSQGETYQFLDDGDLPSTVDWRDQGYVTKVKDQGHCGSCWAFSTTGSLEGQTKKKTGRLVSLSEQNLVDCSKQYGNHGCSGGLMTRAFRYIRDNEGIDSEDYYPYEAKDGECRYRNEYSAATVKSFVRIPGGDEAALTEAIAKVGPISVAIAVSRDFRLYKSGIFEDSTCDKERLSHAVLAVGYGSENGKNYYIVKNSWGANWGENGYIRFARDQDNMCGIATEAVYPVV